jgi:hypothetical protein
VDVDRYLSKGYMLIVLDLSAQLEFRTSASVGFLLGTWDGRSAAETTEVLIGRGGVFTAVGTLDVHHPCEGHMKAHVRVVLPEKYHTWEQMREAVQQVFAALSIPSDETYEADFVSPSRQTGIEQATNRDGVSDRLY